MPPGIRCANAYVALDAATRVWRPSRAQAVPAPSVAQGLGKVVATHGRRKMLAPDERGENALLHTGAFIFNTRRCSASPP